jgi:arsenate reductase
MTQRPSVLYACIHNSGRSVAAQVLTRHYAGDAVTVRSAGSHTPVQLDHGLIDAADVVVTMGCGETCLVPIGTRYEDWPVEDPAGQDLATVRRIVDDIDARVRRLLAELPAAR